MKNKLLLMICMITIWFLVGGKASAGYEFRFSEEELNLPDDGNQYYFLWSTGDSDIPYRLITSPVILTGEHVLWYNDPAYVVRRSDSNYFEFNCYYTNPGSFQWNLYTTTTGNTVLASQIVQSNFDLTYNGCKVGDSCTQYHPAHIGDNFFPLPPTVLVRVMKKVPMKGVMTEVLGILPIAMVCLVGWVALRKGLAMVSLLLRKS